MIQYLLHITSLPVIVIAWPPGLIVKYINKDVKYQMIQTQQERMLWANMDTETLRFLCTQRDALHLSILIHH